MPINLHGRKVLTLDDFSASEIRYLLRLAADLKADVKVWVVPEKKAGETAATEEAPKAEGEQAAPAEETPA